MKRKVKVLFIANIPVADKRSVGGATVLSKNILDYLSLRDELELRHYQYRRFWRPKFQIIDFILLFMKFPFIVSKYDVVSIHSTPDMNVLIGPLIVFLTKLRKRKVIYHFFGGNFDKQYIAAPGLLQKIVNKTTLESDYVFFETKALINYFKEIGNSNKRYLPNSRRRSLNSKPNKLYNKKFVFISRVIKEKGIELLIDAFEKLDNSYFLNVYGPLDSKHYSVLNLNKGNIKYCGVITEDKVESVLLENDVLVLPTFFKGEGYPGIIIEALSVGIPVITTDWKAIGEIIKHSYNGLLCEPKSLDSLYNNIIKVDNELYVTLSDNSWDSFEDFDSDIVFERLLNSYLDH